MKVSPQNCTLLRAPQGKRVAFTAENVENGVVGAPLGQNKGCGSERKRGKRWKNTSRAVTQKTQLAQNALQGTKLLEAADVFWGKYY